MEKNVKSLREIQGFLYETDFRKLKFDDIEQLKFEFQELVGLMESIIERRCETCKGMGGWETSIEDGRYVTIDVDEECPDCEGRGHIGDK